MSFAVLAPAAATAVLFVVVVAEEEAASSSFPSCPFVDFVSDADFVFDFGPSTWPRSREGSIQSRTSLLRVFVSGWGGGVSLWEVESRLLREEDVEGGEEGGGGMLRVRM